MNVRQASERSIRLMKNKIKKCSAQTVAAACIVLCLLFKLSCCCCCTLLIYFLFVLHVPAGRSPIRIVWRVAIFRYIHSACSLIPSGVWRASEPSHPPSGTPFLLPNCRWIDSGSISVEPSLCSGGRRAAVNYFEMKSRLHSSSAECHFLLLPSLNRTDAKNRLVQFILKEILNAVCCFFPSSFDV
jgi:hypothetical protein